MTGKGAILHMLCGKIAAGKSTLAARLGAAPGTIVIAQDHWMSHLYPEELRDIDDYARLIPRLRSAMGPHVVDLLRLGVSVVLDWPANTLASRAWMRGLFETAGARHRLHWLDAPDALCLARLAARNASGAHEYVVSPEEFEAFTRHFAPPTAAEGFAIELHRQHQ